MEIVLGIRFRGWFLWSVICPRDGKGFVFLTSTCYMPVASGAHRWLLSVVACSHILVGLVDILAMFLN